VKFVSAIAYGGLPPDTETGGAKVAVTAYSLTEVVGGVRPTATKFEYTTLTVIGRPAMVPGETEIVSCPVVEFR
jgi:hypothetical protein